MNKTVLIIVCIVCLAAGWFAHSYFAKQKVISTTVKLTDSEQQTLIQQARKGWISPDSANKILAMSKSKAKINWTAHVPVANRNDSTTKPITKDSTNNLVPVYESETTLDVETHNEKGDSAKINLTVNNRFFPEQEIFAPTVKINSVDFSLWVKNPVWYQKFKFAVGLGVVGNDKMLTYGLFFGITYPIEF